MPLDLLTHTLARVMIIVLNVRKVKLQYMEYIWVGFDSVIFVYFVHRYCVTGQSILPDCAGKNNHVQHVLRCLNVLICVGKYCSLQLPIVTV